MEKTLELKIELAKTLAAIKRDFPHTDFENEYEYLTIKDQVYSRSEIDLDEVSDEDWWWAVDHIDYGMNIIKNQEKFEERKQDIKIRLERRQKPTLPVGNEPAKLYLKIMEIRDKVQTLVSQSDIKLCPNDTCYEVRDNAAVVYDGRGIWVVQLELVGFMPREKANFRYIGYKESTNELLVLKYYKYELHGKILRGHILDNYLKKYCI